MSDGAHRDLLNTPASLIGYRALETINPQTDHRKNTPWLDEHIWGHRLYDSQSAWLVFIEFLSVAEGLQADHNTLKDSAPYPLPFRPAQRLHLRNIMFNSDEAMRLAEQETSDSRRWKVWLEYMNQNALGFANRQDFTYLERRFPTFEDFSRVLNLMRSSTVERGSNKRWSSRFLFPFGPHAIYEDLNIKPGGGAPSREYINFGRTGELLYLMLARSKYREALKPVIERMVSPTNRWDRLVSKLQPPGEEAAKRDERGSSYLPYAAHPVFDALARDWLAVCESQLPEFDTYPHLVTLGGLHLVRYFLGIARAWAHPNDHERPLTMVCEIITPKKTLVRELALQSYGSNDALSTMAIERTVTRIGQVPSWLAALQVPSDAYSNCLELLKNQLNWGENYNGSNEPENLLAALRSEARIRHQQHLGQFHRTLGRDIGLVSRRGTNRFRYAPTDDLIKTLLIATVTQRMEYGEFLQTLYDRYGLVIGDQQAKLALEDVEFDQKAFQANARRLEERLASLGLVRRLSDACAYIINPYVTAPAMEQVSA